MPASLEYISSGFGYRADPFTGGGLSRRARFPRPDRRADLCRGGRHRQLRRGPKSGYGNCIEIDHGNGLMTRYAHMSGFAL
jgi:murein DD-endopeptidase MepM/ murein hydrolase activator NlpD